MINNAYKCTWFNISLILTTDPQYLLFLRIWTPASKFALMLVKERDFFIFLLSQTWDNTEEIRKETGSLRSGSTSSWRRTSCIGWVLGRMVWIAERMKLLAVLKGHCRRAWWRLSSTSSVQRSQDALAMSGIWSLKSLSLVGSRSWIIFQRKEVCSEGSPGVTAKLDNDLLETC